MPSEIFTGNEVDAFQRQHNFEGVGQESITTFIASHRAQAARIEALEGKGDILTNDEVVVVEKLVAEWAITQSLGIAREILTCRILGLIASHHVLAARIEELEADAH